MYMRDSEVVASIVAGDPHGLATAYDKYADPLYTYCWSMLKEPADAADAVQDTFVIAASRLDGLRDAERLRAWLYAVARNECLRILRAKKNMSALDEAPDVTDESADVTENAERADMRALLQDASAGLNPGEREVIELQLRQGLEAAEVASVLGVSRNHAHSLLSRARDQLEACLGVLLVGRAGQEECQELGSMLSGWDGRLTVLLRKRLNRHIEHCATCTSRKAFELRPAMFLGVAPLAAMAAAAAESLRLAPHAPAALKGHILALATSSGPSAAAQRAAVLSRAGSFGKGGFPKPLHAAKAGGLLHGGAAKGGFLKSPQGQAAAAAVVVAVAVASVAFALTGNSGTEHLKLAGGKPPTHSAGGGGGGAAPPPPSSKKSSSPASPPPAATTPAALPSTVPPAQPATQPSPSPALTSLRPTTPTPATASPTTSPPSPTASPSPTPSPSPTGTLTAVPDGGDLYPDSFFLLYAQDESVNWAITVTGGNGQVTFSVNGGPESTSDSGTLNPGLPLFVSVNVPVTYQGGATLVVTPGDITYTVEDWGFTRPGGGPSLLPRLEH